MIELIVVISAAVGAFLTKLIDWMFNKTSHKEDARSKVIDNEIKLSNKYKEMLDDIEPRYKAKLIDFEERVKANEELWKKKEELLKEENVLLRKEVRALKVEVKEKNKKIAELLSEKN